MLAKKTFQQIYASPYLSPLRRLKLVSLGTCSIAMASAPAFVFAGSSSLPLSARITTSAVVLATGVGSTGMLYAFTKVMVTRIGVWPSVEYLYNAAHPQANKSKKNKDPTKEAPKISGWDDVLLQVETLDWRARPAIVEIPISQLRTNAGGMVANIEWKRPDGASKNYYIHDGLFMGESKEKEWLWWWLAQDQSNKA